MYRLFGVEHAEGLLLAELLILLGDKRTDVDKVDVLLLGNLPGCLAVVVDADLDAAVLPDIARSERHHDGLRASGLGVADKLAQIPAEGVHGLVLVSGDVIDLLRLFSDAGDGAASDLIVERKDVVLAELEKDDVTGFELRDGFVPQAFGEIGARGTAAAREVDDVDLVGIEESVEEDAPALGLGVALVHAVDVVGGGRVTDDEDAVQLRVEWLGELLRVTEVNDMRTAGAGG